MESMMVRVCAVLLTVAITVNAWANTFNASFTNLNNVTNHNIATETFTTGDTEYTATFDSSMPGRPTDTTSTYTMSLWNGTTLAGSGTCKRNGHCDKLWLTSATGQKSLKVTIPDLANGATQSTNIVWSND